MIEHEEIIIHQINMRAFLLLKNPEIRYYSVKRTYGMNVPDSADKSIRLAGSTFKIRTGRHAFLSTSEHPAFVRYHLYMKTFM